MKAKEKNKKTIDSFTEKEDNKFFPGIAVIDKYEKSLQESEERFRQLSDATTEGIIIHNKGRILEVNKAFCKMLGYEENEMIGMDALMLAVPEAREMIMQRITSGDENPYEVIGIRKDGTNIHCEVSARKITYKGIELRVVAFRDISRRKLYEKALKESEEKYRMLVESASDAIFVMDEKGRFLQTNRQGHTILGYSLEEFMKMSIVDVIPPRDLVKNPLRINEIKHRESFFSERNLKCKNGKTILVEASVTRLPDGNLQAILRDISERKKSEDALKQSQENYKSLIEYSPDGIFIHDERGVVFFANPAALKIMGISALEELKTRNIFHYLLPQYHDVVRERKKKMEDGEHLEFMLMRIKRTDGTIIEVESKPIEIVFEGRKAMLVVYHDISFQRQLEKEQLRAQMAEEANLILQQEIKERKKIEKEIQEGKKYITSLIESSLDVICAVDKEGYVTEFNKAAQEIFGYSREDVVGNHVGILYKDGEDRTKINKDLEATGKFAGEVINKRKNGEEFICFLSASVIKDEKGQIIGSMGVSRDITEKKETEEKIRQSLREKEVLLKEVHHRVKNNLQVISSILNLQSSYVTDEKTLDLFRESQNRIKSMSFIHEILYQTKDFSSINFSDYVVNLTNNLFHSYSRNNNISLKLNVGNVFLNLDLAIPCGLVINELISNALKYAFPGQKKGTINISIKQAEEFITIEIADNGAGLPKNVDYRNTESLGLQLVMTLVEQLEGDIVLDNSKGAKYKIVFRNHHKK